MTKAIVFLDFLISHDGLSNNHANSFLYELPLVNVREGICTLHLVSCVSYRLFDGVTTATVRKRRNIKMTLSKAAHNVLL